MIGPGVQDYLERDLGRGSLVPHQLFLAAGAVQVRYLYPVYCEDPGPDRVPPRADWITGTAGHRPGCNRCSGPSSRL